MIAITEIRPQEYLVDYKNWLDEMKEAGEYKHATVRNKKGVVDEFTEYYTYHGHVIDTDDLYGSFDVIKAFFEQTPVHKTKIAGVREFLEYISKQLPTEDSELVYDMREKLKKRKLMDVHGKVSKDLTDKILTEAELEAVFGVSRPYEWIMMRSLLDTGCRPGELAALAPEDINFGSRKPGIGATIKINKTYSQGIGVQNSPKTENAYRTVNLREDTAQMLHDWLRGRRIVKGALIFGNYRKVYDTFKDVVSYAHVKIGDDGITTLGPHAMRHNTCTRLITKRNYSKEKVQQYMGHGSIKVTEIYEHFNEDEVLDIHVN